ncbi:MAG: hypothetical protein R8G33_04760 [Gammaproteobacteria bacterium]|nr:hypothetical protein [Gammaproteobacteria bacterium]
MSEYRIEIRDAVLSYLQIEFSDFEIQEEQDKESYCFRLINQTDSHFIRVMYSATQSRDANEIGPQLEQYAVASTMRGLGDFPVVVTEQGCIFGSP